MLGSWLSTSPWPALVIGLLITGADLALTTAAASLYYGGAREIISLPGQYAMQKPYNPQGGWRQFWTRRYTLFLIGTAIAIPAAWFVFTRMNRLDWVWEFAIGGLVLFELAECLRLLKVVTLFRLARRGTGIVGRLEAQKWASMNLFVVDQYGLALVFLLAFAATGSVFFFGGAATCFLLGHRVRDWVAVRQTKTARM